MYMETARMQPKAPKPVPVYEIGRPGWHAKAACFESGTLPFFPRDPEEEKSGYMDRNMHRRIQFVCGTCPVLTECFIASMNNRDEYGIWAGIYPAHRTRMLKDIKRGNITLGELVAALAFRGPVGLTDAYRK
jgi:hypothetical protein